MKNLRVLVVDDDRDFAESLAYVLEPHVREVQLAFTGQEAVKKFRETNFDIAFMDVMMPGKNGVESFLEIRKAKPEAKVVMMTGYSVEQLLDQAVEHGAWGVLHKPLDMNLTLAMLENIQPDGILIADDDPEFVESIRELLENEGYTVFVARDGKEAVDRIRNNGIDVLILDLHLPILSGLEVYLELKRTDDVVPTIIVTAYRREEEDALDKLRSLRVSGILLKPFDPRELLSAVEELAPRPRE
jgi:two-component system response regulator HydG